MEPFDCAQDRLREIQESARQRKGTENRPCPSLSLSQISVSNLCLASLSLILEKGHGTIGSAGYWIVMLPAVSVAAGKVVLPITSLSPCVVTVTLNGTPVRVWPLPTSTLLTPPKVTLPSALMEPLLA